MRFYFHCGSGISPSIGVKLLKLVIVSETACLEELKVDKYVSFLFNICLREDSCWEDSLAALLDQGNQNGKDS